MTYTAEERMTDNLLMRIMLETIQNVVGEHGFKSILYYAHLEKYTDSIPPDNDDLVIPAADLHNVRLALVELFGQKGTRGLEQRVGREIIRLSLEKRPCIAKGLQAAGHFLPESTRMRIALEMFMKQMDRRQPSTRVNPRLELQEEDGYFLFIDKDSTNSENVISLEPVCYVYVGMLQYLTEWITGHPHHVEEVECRAMGHPADVFRISKAQQNE